MQTGVQQNNRYPTHSQHFYALWSLIEQGMEVFFFASASSVDELNKTQYEALRLYTGTMRSNSLLRLLQVSGLENLKNTMIPFEYELMDLRSRRNI